MSFLYKYKILLKKDIRIPKEDIYNEIYKIINSVLNEKFGYALKDIYYLDNGVFEFKSFYSISNKHKRTIGKIIKRKINSINMFFEYYRGIKIQYSDMLMSVEVNEENSKKFASIELISSDILNKGNKQYDDRCTRYYKSFKYGGQRKINKQLLYADILTIDDVYIGDNDILNGHCREIGRVLLSAKIKNIERIPIKDKGKQINTIFFQSDETTSKNIPKDAIGELKRNSLVIIEDIHKISEIKELSDAIKIESDSYSSPINHSCDGDIVFTIHNVGQALTTSLESKDSRTPLLFFDLGWKKGKIETKNRIVDCINCSTSDFPIFISHLHTDHYNLLYKTYGIMRNNIHVYSVFGQDKARFNQNMEKIKIEGGNYTQLENSMIVKINDIYTVEIVPCGPLSPLKKQSTSIEHQRGLIMLIYKLDKKTKSNKLYVFVPGDENYDLISSYNDSKKDINKILEYTKVLVATHHGGTYCYDSYEFPENNIDGHKIIYSCGKNNIYKHPSERVCDLYKKAGWGEEAVIDMRTQTEDYEIEI